LEILSVKLVLALFSCVVQLTKKRFGVKQIRVVKSDLLLIYVAA
jgi:hypothetical protein